jgi:transcriptional regulator with XRE-family HTH domain
MNDLDLDEYYFHKQEMGIRFKQFRAAIGKSKQELAEEANIMEARIKWFENGTIIPDIIFIQYFTDNYGLNLTWLVKGTGKAFFKKGEKTPQYVYRVAMEQGIDSSLMQEIIRARKQKRKHFTQIIQDSNVEIDGRMMG